MRHASRAQRGLSRWPRQTDGPPLGAAGTFEKFGGLARELKWPRGPCHGAQLGGV
jgi:hypothetical protein